MIIKALVLIFYYMTFGLVNIGLITETINPDDTTYYDRKIVYDLNFTIPELNNHTLSEVFDDNFYSFSQLTSITSVYSLTHFINFSSNVNDVIYFRHSINIVSGSSLKTLYLQGMEGYTPTYFNKTTGFNNFSSSFISSSTHSRFALFYGFNLIDITYVVNLYLVNQTALGIDTLTVEQLDTYYSYYQLAKAGTPHTEYLQYAFTPNELSRTDVVILGSSLVIWVYGISFLVSIIDLKRRLF